MVGILAEKSKVNGLELAHREMVRRAGEQLIVNHDLGDIFHIGAGKLSRIIIFDVQLNEQDVVMLESFLDGSNTNYVVAAAVNEACLISAEGLKVGNSFADRVKLMKLRTINIKRTEWRKFLVQDLIEVESTYGGADLRIASQVKINAEETVDLGDLDLSVESGYIEVEEREKERGRRGKGPRSQVNIADGLSDNIFDELDSGKDELDFEEEVQGQNNVHVLKGEEDELFDEYGDLDLDLGLDEDIARILTPSPKTKKQSGNSTAAPLAPLKNIQVKGTVKRSQSERKEVVKTEVVKPNKSVVEKPVGSVEIQDVEFVDVEVNFDGDPEQDDMLDEIAETVVEEPEVLNIDLSRSSSPPSRAGKPNQKNESGQEETEGVEASRVRAKINSSSTKEFEEDEFEGLENSQELEEPEDEFDIELESEFETESDASESDESEFDESELDEYELEESFKVPPGTKRGSVNKLLDELDDSDDPVMPSGGSEDVKVSVADKYSKKDSKKGPKKEKGAGSTPVKYKFDENAEYYEDKGDILKFGADGVIRRIGKASYEDGYPIMYLDDGSILELYVAEYDKKGNLIRGGDETTEESETGFDLDAFDDSFNVPDEDADDKMIAAPIEFERPTLIPEKPKARPVRGSKKVEDEDDEFDSHGTIENIEEVQKRAARPRGLGFGKGKAVADAQDIPVAKIKPPKVNDKSLFKHLDAISKGGYSILVTGSRGAGVTTIAYELALTLARLGYNTALMDMDLRSRTTAMLYPDVAQDLHEMGAKNPIMQALHDPRSLSDVALHTMENLDLFVAPVTIPIKELHTNADNVRAVETLVAKASTQYTFTVVDCPIELVKLWGQMSYSSVDKFLWVADYSLKGVMDLAVTDKEFGRGVLIEACELILNRFDPRISIAGRKTVTAFEDILFDFTSTYLLLNDYEIKIIGQIPYDLTIQSGLGTARKYTDTPNGDKFLKSILANF